MTYTRLLKHMMEGPDVMAVKERLVALGYLHAATHDTFGDDTLAAVAAFQAANGLEADGVVGPDTWAALFGGAGTGAPAEPERPAVPDAPVYTRLLRRLSTGADVKAVKERLVALGYLHAATHDTFGDDTLAAVTAFQAANGLEADGVVGPDTWAALFGGAGSGAPVEPERPAVPDAPAYTRLLRRLSTGADVMAVKERLVALGYLHAATHDTFGDDTLAAVTAFQAANGLEADGVVGPDTWAALFGDAKPVEPVDASAIPANIGTAAAQAIAGALSAAAATRRRIVLEALRHAHDPAVPAQYPRSLYIRGGNLYNADLTVNTITAARIEDGARRQPEYYSGGSREMMLAAVAANPATTGADCSGGVVGLMRFARVVGGGFDATANSLCGSGHSAAVEKAALLPGDWVGRSGHIGLYAGGGYVVEWMGQLYGCQLTRLDDRRGFDFVSRRLRSRSGWTKFRRPRYY